MELAIRYFADSTAGLVVIVNGWFACPRRPARPPFDPYPTPATERGTRCGARTRAGRAGTHSGLFVAPISSFLLFLPLILSAATPDKVLPVINEVNRNDPVGQQPYEMTWVQREEHPQTLVDFEDMAGWKLELYNGASGELRRTREQQMWGQYVAKIAYSGSIDGARVVARPPKPVPIPGQPDCVEFWAYGDRLRSAPTGTTLAAGEGVIYLSILLQDAAGNEHRIQATDMRWRGWWLVHRKLSAELQSAIAWPAAVSGIELEMGRLADRRQVFCDSLAFYREALKPLNLKPQPKRNLRPFRGQIVGLNTGVGTLPFPTREETILPSNFEKDFRNAVLRTAPGRFELHYQGRDATVVYEYRPRTGTLGEITVRVANGAPFRPLDRGGVRMAGVPPATPTSGELVYASLKDNAVEASFRFGSQIVDYKLQIWQKSLVLDVWCDGGQAAELLFGRVAGVANPRLIAVPYITYGRFNPRVLISGDGPQRTFTSVWFDWYRSNATEPIFPAEARAAAGEAEINGGLRYVAKTDGVRNNLYDRVFVTVSPVYEETLPTVANPPSLRQAEGKQVVWTVTSPETFTKDHQRCRRIRSYGLDKIMQHSHEVTWRDDTDSYTMRLHAAPQKGGDKMLQWYIKAQNDLGWLQGVYTNYCDFAPVNSNWNPDFVQRWPDGEWRRAWYRTYALKPAKAVEMDEYHAPRIKEKFGVKMSYTDVHTDNPPPWEYCDFDARVPGAGTFAATFYAYGQLLLNDQRIYGPSQSESTFQWLFAGLQSGGYGWVYTDINLLTHPVDVAFRIHKLNPLECDYGMGATNYYLSRLDPEWRTSPRRRDYVDLFLATTIAYGNMGWLVADWGLDDPFGVEVLARSYYMMQQLQQQYAFERPKVIEYAARDGRFLSPSRAHATGDLAASRLHVEYENGTHVYVNRGTSGEWTVKDHQGRAVSLPVNGWLAFNPKDKIYEYSASMGGRRIDFVNAPEYEFLDGRGQWTEQGSLGVTGSAALRRKSRGALEVTDIYGNNRLAFRTGRAGVLRAFDPEGRLLGEVATSSSRSGWHEFTPLTGARTYVFE